MLRNRLIRGILYFANPRLNLCNSHYVCGCNLAIFTSFVEIENCLTDTTCKLKCLPTYNDKIIDENNIE